MSLSETSEVGAVVEAIRANDRFLLVTHENPDGDALGSIRALKLALDALGKDNVAYLGGGMDIPREYEVMPMDWRKRELAAELVEAGAVVHDVFQRVYENVPFAKLKLKARALDRAQVYEGGRMVVSYLLRGDFDELGVGEEYAEGIIDDLRAVDGAELAA